jgi:hypothetical protein
MYKHNPKLQQRLEAALGERGEPTLLERFAALWH